MALMSQDTFHSNKIYFILIIWKSALALMNAPFEWAPFYTAGKFNERPSLNGRSPQTRKGVLIWK